ncbi:nuclear transport factor 2 family protein [Streptomyces smyrnaeus]|uniref:Nuclear transport factor 2 family protein n=1 Tax=Streptomyces smyrnaeus TaxID=1387713 RepID=A0ABS3XN97_9ACTN|nr:nuclear transport factor 2 family protein [Streptomyces smyrnaeus]MBO8196780.1 nuclear transport factor 2 family protein [Streptomyces smyrnaeus]
MRKNIGELATRCLRRFESCDFTCTETATAWHNDGKGDQTIDEKPEQLEPLADEVDPLRFYITRQFRGANGVIQQQVLRSKTSDGSRSDCHAAMYFRFDGHLIDRMEEYAYEMPSA